MSDYTDDFVHFVTVSPPPMEREDQKDPFLSIDQSISLGHPDFSHHADFANLQNSTNPSNLDGMHTFGGLHHFNDSQYSGDGLQALQNPQSLNSMHSLSSPSNLHSPQNFPPSLQSPQNLPQNIQNIQNLRNVSQTPASGTELESSLVSPNSASSYDRNALNRFHTDPNHSGYDSNSFLFSNPTPISSSNLLAPSQFGLLGGGSANSSYANSAYSEVSSNAQVPYQDAASHFSAASANYAAALEPKDSYFEPLPTQLRARDSFNQEISLGQSISTTNLMQMTSPYDSPVAPDPKFSHSPTVPRNGYGQSYSDIGQQSFQLTENNLSSYNDIENKVTISIQEAPEVVARKTPSLFSNSSHNSSNTPGQGHHSNSAQPHLQRPDYYPSVPSSPSGASPAYSLNSPLDASGSDSQFLNPEDFQNIKRGRQSAHSRKVHSRSNSRSRSRSRDPGNYSGAETSDYDSDYDGEKEQSLKAMSAREKMLELANAPMVTKRTQIHPSLYACNLCEKRFTRPYNLKSHLRTHTDERPYICNVCGKAFARQHDKKRHEELHSGEKKFQCKGVLRDGTEFGCSRKFARADALRRHFQTEAGKECIRLLVEEEKASQNQNQPHNVNSGIQLPDGKFMNSYFSDVPMVSIQSPETGYD